MTTMQSGKRVLMNFLMAPWLLWLSVMPVKLTVAPVVHRSLSLKATTQSSVAKSSSAAMVRKGAPFV